MTDDPAGGDPSATGPADPERAAGQHPHEHEHTHEHTRDDDEAGQEQDLDVESAFAAIVADWGRDDGTPRSWPAAEDVTHGRRRTDVTETTDTTADAPEPADEPAAPRRPADEERFVPPEPPPLPLGDAFTVLAWAGAVGGPIVLLLAVLFWRDAPQLLLMGSIAAFVAGFVTLVARMPQHRDDDGDDGARV